MSLWSPIASRVSSSVGAGPPGLDSHPQQRGIEDLFFRRGVQFQEGRQPVPDRAEGVRVGPVDLFQDREETALLVMVVEDQLRDIHRMPSFRALGSVLEPEG